MPVIKNFVLLFKAPKEDGEADPFKGKLQDQGFKVESVATLGFTYKNLRDLSEKLNHPESYSGIIFTSPRCVSAVSMAQKLASDKLLDEWFENEHFAVGMSTSAAALNILGLKCEGEQTGNAENLSGFILGRGKFSKPFLVPHGNLRTDTLSSELTNGGVILDEILTYYSLANLDIDKEFEGATKNKTAMPTYVVFFSPSAVQAATSILKEISTIGEINVIAIGPSTKKALEQKGIKVNNMCSSPTPEDLICALHESINRQ